MSHSDVYGAVSPHVPCSHMEWPDDSAPSLPWALYYGKTKPFSADDSQIALRWEWTVELYEKRRDSKLESELAASLRRTFGSIGTEESWVENDNMLMVAFTFSQLEGVHDGTEQD